MDIRTVIIPGGKIYIYTNNNGQTAIIVAEEDMCRVLLPQDTYGYIFKALKDAQEFTKDELEKMEMEE